jgi:acyl-CoA thioester hydrolase
MSHRFHLRVYWEDTDAAGIVYYANYLKFVERARTEALIAAGLSQGAIREELGVVFAVREAAVRYLAPARLEDQLVVTTSVTELRGARIAMAQDVWRGETALARCGIVLACLDASGRAARVPAAVRAALAPLLAGPGAGTGQITGN